MMRLRRNLHARLGFAAALATVVAVLGCREPATAPPPQGDLLPTHTRVTGLGAIKPPDELLEFDFDVNDALSGHFYVTWHYYWEGGGVEYLTVDPATDPATRFISFSRTSATCVRFYAIGRQHDTLGDLLQFWVDACDNRSPGTGYDTFTLTTDGVFYFMRSGTLSKGDIAMSTF